MFMVPKRRKKVAVPPYSKLSEIYDRVMSHVDYEKWAEYVEQIIDRHSVHGEQIVDFSCGTGTLCSKLAERGWSVIGCDTSMPMLKKARQKYYDQPFGHFFFCTDIRYPPANRAFGVIVSLYDSMNYLISKADWKICLNHVYQALCDGGLFIFDVSTVYNSISDFADFYKRDQFSDASYVRKSRYIVDEGIQENYFEIKLESDPEYIFTERHRQRIRALNTVRNMIFESPFKLLGSYRDFSFHPMIEDCERVHFVLQRQS